MKPSSKQPAEKGANGPNHPPLRQDQSSPARQGEIPLRPTRLPFPEETPKKTRPLTLLAAGLMVLLLFALLPASQVLSRFGEPPEAFREVAVLPPPPPPPPAETEPPPPPEPDRPAPPRIEPSLTPVATEGLEIELRPTVEDSMLATGDFGWIGSGIDVRDEVERFTFDDLRSPPRPISVPSIEIPRPLLRAGFREGTVVLYIRIDRRGRVDVIDVIESSHRELEMPARRAAARSLFEVPTIEGEPTEVYGHWPLTIRVE